ncbi:hypothetical protein TDB9533_01262 [Thalassocella blandensis]|nr:hypothetical protein TDB9533_01262 [Thalassocella blandensis]
MSIEIGKKETPLEILACQVQFIKIQERDKVPSEHLKIRCPCLKLVRWIDAFRCLYCGIFYCRTCAEKHFGQTVEEYKAINTQ